MVAESSLSGLRMLFKFNTMVLKERRKNGGKTLKKVRRFFSRSNQFLVAFNMSREIKKLREKLDNIAKNRQQFGFTDVFVPPMQRKETGSYARDDSIIGREADKAAIVGWLLGESEPQTVVQKNVTFATIVGMGGLGKTALAQLVYNDEKVKSEFNVRSWVCVSNEFGMEQIFAKMTGKNAGIGVEELQTEVRNMIEGRKYLLVLDDVWDENHNKWVELRDFFMLGGKGSRVLITSRSKAVARAIGNNHTYELQGLSDEYSWRLFKKMAFETGKSPLDQELVDIGNDVVKKCANVPRLHKLEIDGCPNMTAGPRCPSLKTLKLLGVHEEFRFISNPSSVVDPGPSHLDPPDLLPHTEYVSSSDSTFYLEQLNIDKVELVNLLFGVSLKGIDILRIHGFQPEILSAAADLFGRHVSSIRSLGLFGCPGLKSLRGGGIEHLTSLRYLSIEDSEELDLEEGEEFKSLKNLDNLALWSLSKLIYLPEGFQHLSFLRTLRICYCKLELLPEWLSSLPLSLLWLQSCTELKSLPEAIRHMSSLSKLRVWHCHSLNDRLREPDGQDWPKISHIPILDIRN